MEIFNFAMYLLAFGTGTSALPDPELGSVTDGEFTYTGGDLPRGDAKIRHLNAPSATYNRLKSTYAVETLGNRDVDLRCDWQPMVVDMYRHGHLKDL
ncbi:hypothetical protein E4U50_008228, partial [Claviceps purpurea]